MVMPKWRLCSPRGRYSIVPHAYAAALLPQPSDQRKSMWRFSNLLPIDNGPILYPLPAGATLLVTPHRVLEVTHLPYLWLKDEPKTVTGSNKDRATALVLEHALRCRIDVITCASTGNVAVSLL
jgi:threonine synthase